MRAGQPQSDLAIRPRSGFTLIELLITTTIIGIMATMILVAMNSAMETAREQKTKALIVKLDEIIKNRWEQYRTRRIEIPLVDQWNDANGNGSVDPGELVLDFNGNGSIDPPLRPDEAAKVRLDALHDLMRMELPDRWTDITDNPVAPNPPPIGPTPAAPLGVAGFKIARPAVSRVYLQKFNASKNINPSRHNDFMSAECLYMIVMSAVAEEGDAREVFKADDIADTDKDGFPEFVDGWKRPIHFLRWPVGFQSELQTVATGKVSNYNSGMATLSSTTVGPQSPGAFNGGAVYFYDKSTPGQRQLRFSSRISRYDSGVYILRTDGSAQAFGGQSPSNGDEFVVMGPDPFDPSGVYANISNFPLFPAGGPSTRTASCAVYPLIYSSGRDKCYGITANITPGGGPSFSYGDPSIGLSPFFTGPAGDVVGNQKDETGEEFFVKNGWVDNIHNHNIGTR